MISVSMSTSIKNGNWAICEAYIAVSIVENNVFTDSLIGATIQDGGKRERSDFKINYYYTDIKKVWENVIYELLKGCRGIS